MPRKKKVSPKSYGSKLLLFGEHIINRGAKGLAIPTDHFVGHFEIQARDSFSISSNKSLQSLADYIIGDLSLLKKYDTNKLLADIEKGLYFDSTIPQGYGMGSSGALVAAVVDTYRKEKIDINDWNTIKTELALVERHFHGTSSGLDPLVCLLAKAVIIEQEQVSKVFTLLPSPNPQMTVFVINTGMPRSTAPYVRLFLEKYQELDFREMVTSSLVKASDLCIDSFLNQKYVHFWKSLKLISHLHYEHLPEFIPDAYKPIWKQGIAYNEYYLKICGAGGGGFILGVAKKQHDIKTLFSQYEVIALFDF